MIPSPYPDQTPLYRDAIRKWGVEAQMRMVIEEMAELTKEICKSMRREGELHVGITEELVDVDIMLDQLRVIMLDGGGPIFHAEYCRSRKEKLERLRKMLEKED